MMNEYMKLYKEHEASYDKAKKVLAEVLENVDQGLPLYLLESAFEEALVTIRSENEKSFPDNGIEIRQLPGMCLN
jgi:hypothetical protein